MSYEELDQYDKDVLEIESPQLWKYVINGEPIAPEHNNKYMNVLMDYVIKRRTDYKSNVP